MVVVEKRQTGRLAVEIYPDREVMGTAAAAQVAELVRQLQSKQREVVIVFAAAPSQNEFLAMLSQESRLNWMRVRAFHMDEYVGLTADTHQSFRRYLQEHLFGLVEPGHVHLIRGEAEDSDAECRRYAELLEAHPVDIVCAGIGENGHLAFNDPEVADFEDLQLVKVVELDEECRMQQVHDGRFESIDLVPRKAYTLTIPALMRARAIFCVVPGPTKTEAVRRALEGPVSTACPASVLRRHSSAVLFLDRQSAALLDRSGYWRRP